MDNVQECLDDSSESSNEMGKDDSQTFKRLKKSFAPSSQVSKKSSSALQLLPCGNYSSDDSDSLVVEETIIKKNTTLSRQSSVEVVELMDSQEH